MAKAPSNDDFKTEQEKAPADPVTKTKEADKLVTMEDLGIGPRDPYPTGNPPEPVVAPSTDRAPLFKQADQPAPPVRSSRT